MKFNLGNLLQIYINNSELRLIRCAAEVTCSFEDVQIRAYEILKNMLVSKASNTYELYCHNPTQVLEYLINRSVYLQAAGGIVKTFCKRYLLIYRKGCWDLPKGKLEHGEEPLHAAIREVQEETGIKIIKRATFFHCTYHAYTILTDIVIKKTFWYKMYTNKQNLTPQVEEGISQAVWLPRSSIESIVYQNTYTLVMNLLRSAL